jgi:GNAT superfamily N-acetyltransferase
MTPRFTIRRYQPADQPGIEALQRRVELYRPDDMSEVEAMRDRAARAREAGIGWAPHEPSPDSIDDVERWYAAFWVALVRDRIAGMVGVRRSFTPQAPPRDTWHQRTDVAELRRLRVAPEARRTGIGAALTRAVIDWSRAEGCSVLYLHTTSPQAPARALYERLGFRDVLHTLTGEYESVWYAMDLTSAIGK